MELLRLHVANVYYGANEKINSLKNIAGCFHFAIFNQKNSTETEYVKNFISFSSRKCAENFSDYTEFTMYADRSK